MKIGFIGAGRVGYSLAKYLNDNFICVKGFYSKNIQDSIDAATFCGCKYYDKLSDLALNCDTLFLTVNDDSIKEVVEDLIKLNIKNKILIHTSGCHTSEMFLDLNENNKCYSLHPIGAFNDKYHSYEIIDKIYFTIEGNDISDDILNLFKGRIKIINSDDKIKYHAGCVMISNLVCGLFNEADEIFKGMNLDLSCFMPLIENNINNIKLYGPKNALTGPVIRNDIETINKHIDSLDGDIKKIYILLSKSLVNIAKNITNKDYQELNNLLEEKI